MEVAIGLYSLAVPILFDWLGDFFVVSTRVVGDSPEIVLHILIDTAVAALAPPPTLLMGGTLPVLTRFVAAGRSQPGRAAGWLYAANTAGAVMGCFVTGCLLIYWLGVIETNLVAAFIDLGVGVAAARPGTDGRSVLTPDVDRPDRGIGPALTRPWGMWRCWSRPSRGSAGWRMNCSGRAACWRPSRTIPLTPSR